MWTWYLQLTVNVPKYRYWKSWQSSAIFSKFKIWHRYLIKSAADEILNLIQSEQAGSFVLIYNAKWNHRHRQWLKKKLWIKGKECACSCCTVSSFHRNFIGTFFMAKSSVTLECDKTHDSPTSLQRSVHFGNGMFILACWQRPEHGSLFTDVWRSLSVVPLPAYCP